MVLVESSRPSPFWRALLSSGALLGALIALISGCQCQKTITSQPIVLENAQSDEDHLAEAFKHLSQLDEQQMMVGYRQVEFHLNEWLRRQDAPADWSRDPMLDRLPKDFGPMVHADFLGHDQFLAPDIRHLDEAYTLREAGNWITASPSPDPQLTTWLEGARPRIGNKGVDDLAATERLFDWSIRNIQLDPLPPPPRAKPAGPDAPSGIAPKPQPAPGASQFPLNTILYGHGDAWERGRVFIGLCRQHGLLAVVLGFQDERSTWMRPWTVAVVIGDQLYLFDPALGLPIPGENGQGIATLEELRAKPELLRQLDAEGAAYPVAAGDLTGAMALIEVEPLALTRRVYQLEKKLTGAKRLALSVSPTKLAERLRQFKLLADVRVWSVPFQTYLFKDQVQSNRELNDEANRELFLAANPPLGFGRRRHLAGKVENDTRAGAKRIYMDARPTESQVKDLERDEQMQKLILRPLAGQNPSLLENPQWRKANFELARKQIAEMRLQTSYWLGVASYDAQQYSAAVNHFEKRVLKDAPGSKREWGARYSLGRSYEALGQYDKAREIYFTDDGPQKIGSFLRAKRLEGKMPPAATP